ncbi:MAG TPA: TIGR03618 family F420-dependent PPOX class oxidoreductase [Acidimicrobiales bacterium]|nr:TIGR03618 family F420-dependent PPOX class oxidoreductase [Acidimicrobiales bacterium]
MYRLDLDDGFRRILRELMDQFLSMLEDPGAPVLHRVFPPAYSDLADVALQDEYRQLMMEDLVERKRAECQLVVDTAAAKTLTDDQLLAWSRAINGLRLAIGTYLGVTEDEDQELPDSAEASAYYLLSVLLEEAVDAMSRHTRGMEIDAALSYLREHHHSVLITRRRDGEPNPSPVVHGVDAAGRVVISSREPAYKVRNLRADPRAVLCAFRDEFFGPWVRLSGPAEIIALPEAMPGLEDLYRQVAGEHPDWDDYRAAMVRDRRVLIAISPESAGPDREA